MKRFEGHIGSVLVLGLGKSGRICTNYCEALLGDRVDSLTVAAGPKNQDAQRFAAEHPACTFVFDSEEIFGSYDICIASPGIPETGDFYQNAARASREIISEVEFAWRESADSSTWIAITGTNGKTTTTSLAASLAKACGMNASAVGNIGDTCLAAVEAGKTDVYVAEVSSFQLASTRYFAPHVAVLLNITPDHISWHGSFEAYTDAKKQVYAHLGAGDAFVACVEDPEVEKAAREFVASGTPATCFHVVSPQTQGIPSAYDAPYAYVDDKDAGMLCVDMGNGPIPLVHERELNIKGAHNVTNALAAAAAVMAIGGSPEGIRKGLREFKPLAHRIEPCGVVGGVECYNDSKATNVDATLKALAAFGDRKPIVLLGGFDKGTSLDALVEAARTHCKAVVCFGAAGDRFANAFDGSSIPVLRANRLENALDTALNAASAGDIVALSPACSSFDEFNCYQERGDVFKKLVADRAQAISSARVQESSGKEC